MAISLRGANGAGGTGISSVSFPLIGWGTGSSPVPGDLVIIYGELESTTAGNWSQTAGTGTYTFQATGDLNSTLGGIVSFAAWRVFQATDTAPTFTAPDPGFAISIDTWATTKIDTTSSTTHQANAATAAGANEMSLLLHLFVATAQGTTTFTFTHEASWPQQATRSQAGTATTYSQLNATSDQGPVSGTVTPGTCTTSVATAATIYHVLVTETLIPFAPVQRYPRAAWRNVPPPRRPPAVPATVPAVVAPPPALPPLRGYRAPQNARRVAARLAAAPVVPPPAPPPRRIPRQPAGRPRPVQLPAGGVSQPAPALPPAPRRQARPWPLRPLRVQRPAGGISQPAGVPSSPVAPRLRAFRRAGQSRVAFPLLPPPSLPAPRRVARPATARARSSQVPAGGVSQPPGVPAQPRGQPRGLVARLRLASARITTSPPPAVRPAPVRRPLVPRPRPAPVTLAGQPPPSAAAGPAASLRQPRRVSGRVWRALRSYLPGVILPPRPGGQVTISSPAQARLTITPASPWALSVTPAQPAILTGASTGQQSRLVAGPPANAEWSSGAPVSMLTAVTIP